MNKNIIDIDWKSAIAQELKTKIEKIISKHEDCFYSPWAELRKEIFDAIDYLLLFDLENDCKNIRLESEVDIENRCECQHHEISFKEGSRYCQTCGKLLRAA